MSGPERSISDRHGDGSTTRRGEEPTAGAAKARAPADGPWTPDEEPALTARSVVASTLLGAHPPRLPTGLLVRSCALFAISDGTARVAISRMVAAGELEPDEGGYALAGPLRARQARQDLSRGATTRPWTAEGDGWRMAIVVAEGRTATDRSELRRATRTLRLAELREGVWLRPDNLPPRTQPEAAAVVASQATTLRAHPEGDPAALAASLWDLTGWAARGRRLLAALEATRPALDRSERSAVPGAFVLSAAVLRHLQSDPLLPAALLADDWPGTALRSGHRDWNAAFLALWVDGYRRPQGDGRTARRRKDVS